MQPQCAMTICNDPFGFVEHVRGNIQNALTPKQIIYRGSYRYHHVAIATESLSQHTVLRMFLLHNCVASAQLRNKPSARLSFALAFLLQSKFGNLLQRKLDNSPHKHSMLNDQDYIYIVFPYQVDTA